MRATYRPVIESDKGNSKQQTRETLYTRALGFNDLVDVLKRIMELRHQKAARKQGPGSAWLFKWRQHHQQEGSRHGNTISSDPRPPPLGIDIIAIRARHQTATTLCRG